MLPGGQCHPVGDSWRKFDEAAEQSACKSNSRTRSVRRLESAAEQDTPADEEIFFRGPDAA